MYDNIANSIFNVLMRLVMLVFFSLFYSILYERHFLFIHIKQGLHPFNCLCIFFTCQRIGDNRRVTPNKIKESIWLPSKQGTEGGNTR